MKKGGPWLVAPFLLTCVYPTSIYSYAEQMVKELCIRDWDWGACKAPVIYFFRYFGARRRETYYYLHVLRNNDELALYIERCALTPATFGGINT